MAMSVVSSSLSPSPESNTTDLHHDEHSQSVNNKSSPIEYTDDFEALPANGPVNHAHIIALSPNLFCPTQDRITARLQDVVATTLFQRSPATLKSFMCPTVNTFKAIFGQKDTKLIIWRKGLEVFIGTYEHHPSMKAYRFELVAGFLIGYDGSWRLKVTASNAYANAKWPEVWAGKFFENGGVARMSVEVAEADMAGRASKLAGAIIQAKYWTMKHDVRFG